MGKKEFGDKLQRMWQILPMEDAVNIFSFSYLLK